MNPIKNTARPMTWLLVAVVVIFAMNTVSPVALYFEHRWPLVSLGAAVCIWTFVAAQPRNAWYDRMTAMTWLLFSAYLIHGFEVDGIDLLGREFYFQTHVAESRGIELSAGDIMRMNTVTIYLLFCCALWGGERFPWAGVAAAGVTLTNGLMHTANSIMLAEYNPGLGTSLLLFLPGATYYLYRMYRVIGLSKLTIGSWALYGLFGHIALLPLCVLLDTPMWLMAGFPMVPLLLNIALTRNDVMLERSVT
jgi:hypothetical protein